MFEFAFFIITHARKTCDVFVLQGAKPYNDASSCGSGVLVGLLQRTFFCEGVSWFRLN